VKAIFAIGYFTGMRRSEILGLTWDKIDKKSRTINLAAADTKDKQARVIPICDELWAILKEIPQNIHEPHLFQYRGKPISDIRDSLRPACKAAGVVYGRFQKDGFIFHDLRHTFNTNMRKAGVAESVIMAITGHSTREMFDRYNVVDLDDTRKAVHQLEGHLKAVH
jgi:integrase